MESVDLKYELLNVKRQLQYANVTNNLLKVKVRKLENESIQRNKQIEELLDPRKNAEICKIVSEKGAQLILSLKRKNENLENELVHKDIEIRKLRAELQLFKIYAVDSRNQRRKDDAGSISSPSLRSDRICKNSTSCNCNSCGTAASIARGPKNDTAHNLFKDKLTNNLQQIKANLKDYPQNTPNDNYASSAAEAYNLQSLDTRICRLLEEVAKMKRTVMQLSSEHEETRKVIEQRSSLMERLAQQIKTLQLRQVLKNGRKRRKRAKLFRSIANFTATSQSYQKSASISCDDISEVFDALSITAQVDSIDLNRDITHLQHNDDDDDVQTEFFMD